MAGELIRFPTKPAVSPATSDGGTGDGLAPEPPAEPPAPASTVAPAGPVLDAELVDEAEYRVARLRRVMDTRPVVPDWLRDRAQRRETVRWASRYTSHRARYHTVRTPIYTLRLCASSPRGAGRALTGWARWCFDAEGRPLRVDSVATLDADTYLKLARLRRDRVRARLAVTVIVIVLGGVGLLVLNVVWPLGCWLLTAAAVLGLGVVGRRADKPIITPATVTQQATKLTPHVVIRAYMAAALCKPDTPITFAQPIQRDGKGWLAVLDLPYGRTFKQAVTKHDALASGLNVNAITVFLDPDPVSERRVRMWVSDVDVFAQKPVRSPLARVEQFDFWQPIPFGLDARDRLVTLPLVWSSLLVGAVPRMGKTFAARIPAAAAALDPHVRMYVFNGKGDGAWGAFEQVAHVYGRGIRDEVVELLVAALRELVEDMNDRYERMANLPSDVCPDAKLTPALARNRRLNMPLTGVWIDEVQRYLEHPEHGATILDLLTDLVKVGPAAGIMLVLATQKPDSKVIPDSLRGQIGTRFAMRVMTWQASETILGAGTYPAGMDASKFLRKHKGVGILLGADDGELSERGGQDARTHIIDGPMLDAVCARGRALREAEGTLTGMAAGDMPVTEHRPARVLDDLAAVFAPGEDRGWSETLVARLAERNPSAYDGWTANQLATALKPYGVTPTQVWAETDDGKRANRRGYLRDTITAALAARLDNP